MSGWSDPQWYRLWGEWGRRSVRDRHHRGLPALLQPVALTVHLQDVNVVCQPVEQRSGQSLRSEHIGPLVERQFNSRGHALFHCDPAPAGRWGRPERRRCWTGKLALQQIRIGTKPSVRISPLRRCSH